MFKLKQWWDYLSWPLLAGLLAGGLAVLMVPLMWPGEQPVDPQLPPMTGLAPGGDEEWQGPVSYANAVERAAASVVNIYTRKTERRRRHPLIDDPLFQHFFNNSDIPLQERMQSALGSGVIISARGYLLTNNHVIEGADEILVLLNDGREARATEVGSDPETDLAVLKIELDKLNPIPVGEPGSVRVGDVVLAIGNPFGVGQTVTQGIISATGRYGLGLNTYENFLQTDAAINPGNSGGALIDAYGNLLGINTAILDKTGSNVGIGFAIPADTAIKVLEDIVQYGKVVRGWLGIEAQQLSPELAQSFNLSSTNGVIVTAIYNGGPAHKAGLRPGDVITMINEKPVGDGRRGMNEIANTQPGTEVAIDLVRNGKPLQVKAVIGTRPTAS